MPFSALCFSGMVMTSCAFKRRIVFIQLMLIIFEVFFLLLAYV